MIMSEQLPMEGCGAVLPSRLWFHHQWCYKDENERAWEAILTEGPGTTVQLQMWQTEGPFQEPTLPRHASRPYIRNTPMPLMLQVYPYGRYRDESSRFWVVISQEILTGGALQFILHHTDGDDE